MQPVAAVQIPAEPRRLVGIAHRRVEVDDPVVGAALADPRVEGLPLRLARVRPVEGALERRQGAAVDGQPPRVCPLDQRPVARDQVVDRRPRIVERHPDVVGRLEDDDVGRPQLQQHVAVEPREAARPEEPVGVRRLLRIRGRGAAGAAEDAEARVVAEHPVAGNADVQDAGRRVAELGREPPRQEVGPAPVRVDRRPAAVGDGIAHCHHGAGRRVRPHVDARQVEPLLRVALVLELHRPDVIAPAPTRPSSTAR